MPSLDYIGVGFLDVSRVFNVGFDRSNFAEGLLVSVDFNDCDYFGVWCGKGLVYVARFVLCLLQVAGSSSIDLGMILVV